MHLTFDTSATSYLQNQRVAYTDWSNVNVHIIYWLQWVNQGIPPGAANDHEIMVTDYKVFFTSLIKSSFDTSVNPATRDTVLAAFRMGGLDSTTVWNILPTSIRCKYNLINVIGQDGRTGSQSNPCGAAFNADTIGLKPPCRH